VHDTLAEILRREDFATAAFVGGAYFDPRFGLAQGFETYSYAKIDHAATSAYDYSDIAFNTRRALSWLKRNRDRRFFLFFHSYEVHSPFTPRQGHIDRFLPKDAEPPLASVQMTSNSRAKPLEPPWTGWKKFVDSPGSGRTLSQTGIARIRAIYDSEIRVTDAYLEKLLAELERDDLLDDTVVVFTSDHGEAFFEHGRVGHGHLYADNLRVPLILRFPAKLPANAVVEERVQLADVVPTCLELLGVSVPTGVEGVSLVSRLTRGEPLPERAVISTGHIAGISYVTPGGGKLIAPLLADHAVGHPQYFELETDPGELDDRYPELDAVRIAQLRREVAVVLEEFHGLHFVFSPRSPSRFEGTLSLDGPKRSLKDRLRVFPLEHGWLSIDADGDARVATGWFDRWWLHLGPQHGRFTVTGRLIDKDGHAVEIDRSFSLGSDDAGDRIPAAGAAEPTAVLRAFAVTLDGNAASEAPPEPDISDETRRQLELLGYAD
jgi:hypothetical protein